MGGASGVFVFSPETNGVSGGGATGATRTLVGGGARNVFDQQGIDAAPGIEARDAGEAGIDHQPHAIDGQGSFGDIGGDDDLAVVVTGDGGILIGGRQFAVEGQKNGTLGGGSVAQGLERALDFVGPGHEDEGVAGIISLAGGLLVGGGSGVPGGVAVGVQRLDDVLDLDREGASIGMNQRAGLQIGLQQAGVERGGHHDEE